MDNWDLMRHWSLVLPPSRPSASQLSKIRTTLQEAPKTGAVAVLGSTPEFRDLFHELGFPNIFVFDRNQRFYDAMSSYRVYRNAETFVRGDWLDTLPRFANRFDCILSDLTSGNVPYVLREQFYLAIEMALAPSGYFFDKVLTHERPLLLVDDLMKKYALLPMNLLHINYFSSEMLFCSELLGHDAIVDSSRFYATLDRLVTNERVRAFAQHAKDITPPGCRWWYGRSWAALEPQYCPGLVRVSVADDGVDSPYRGFVKFFELQKQG